MPSDRVENREQLQALLRDLFQFDASELDFGIYRILNQRRDRIERFIEEDLLDAVDESLESLATAQREELREQIEDTREAVTNEFSEEAIGPGGSLNEPHDEIDHPTLDRYRRLRGELDSVKVAEETEARIFNDLYRFFSRYYEDGDFHTKRRISSKDSKYYVPYNGEETYFHWANRDQYYVKTSEHFTDYRFDAGTISVEFRLEDADVPQDNVKGDGRYFVLGRGDPVSFDEDGHELTINFQYRQITEDEAREIVDGYNEATGEDRSSFAHMNPDMRCDALEGWILERIDIPGVQQALTEPASENGDDTSRLKRHLRRYVSENTMDYFVHKDLGGFLNGELEFFLKNEVLDVENLIRTEDAQHPDVLRARTVKEIAERIIEFLAQIEDFQKRLFEKRKFVVQTEFLVTLDYVPDELYSAILENEEQLEQWREIYGLDEWETDLRWHGEINETFLENHPHLMVDTALFDERFTYAIISRFDDVDAQTDGLLVHAENFQAINLIESRFKEEIKCSYIDPPYNTGNDDFNYKDSYQHSSWLSMMADRLSIATNLLNKGGVLFSSIDDREYHRLTTLMNDIFGEGNHVASFVWKRRTSTAMRDEPISPDHEYALLYANSRDESLLYGLPPDPEDYPREDENGRFASTDLTVGMTKEQRPGQFYTITNPRTGEIYEPNPERVWRFYPETMEEVIAEDRILWPGEEGGNMTRPRYKTYYNPEELEPRPVSTWIEGASMDDEEAERIEREYQVSLFRTHRNEQGGRELRDILPGIETYYPKPVSLVQNFVRASTQANDRIIDFFAGSGTTGQAVIEQNREDNGERKYILVEMGRYFDTVLKPRLQKVVFSSNWADGVPQDVDGTSQLIKYQRLESYEDALNNVTLQTSDADRHQPLTGEFDDYVEGYMLNFESKDSPSLLPEGTFDDPFNHELKIEQDGSSREPTSVDLVETFHYLIGAHVRQYVHDTQQDRKYVVTECEVETESTTEKILIAWRKTEDLDLETEADWFDDEFDAESYDRVYVNGESFIAQSEPLEITFRERMEAPPDIT